MEIFKNIVFCWHFWGYESKESDGVLKSDKKKLFFLGNNKKDTKKIMKNKSNKKIKKKIKEDKIKRDPNSPFAVLEKLL